MKLASKTASATGRAGIRAAWRRWGGPAAIVVILIFAVLFPRSMGSDSVWNLFFLVALGISMGQSWNMLGGFAGQTSLGHAAFFGIGTIITREMWFAGVPFVVSFIAGGVAAAAFAMIIGAPTFRLRGAYFAIGTLAVAEVLRITVGQNRPFISTMPGTMIASYNLPRAYYVALALALATTAAAYLLLRSRWSLGILGVREDQEAAQATGVHVLRHKLLALGLSALFMGFAGAVFAFKQISYYPEAPFGPNFTFEALMIAYIGGVGTVLGPVVGGAFFVVVRERLAANLTDVHQVIFGVLFILVVLVFPGGLLEIWDRVRRFAVRRWKRRTAGAPGVEGPAGPGEGAAVVPVGAAAGQAAAAQPAADERPGGGTRQSE
jgi:branched-chain amino acid transport system permease protein